VGDAPQVTDEAFRRIDTLIGVGMRLARSAPSGRILLARIAEAVEPAWIPQPWGETIVAELASARAAAREPIEIRRIERALREAWGTKPTDELDSLDPEPVAVTPTSQVHRGVLQGAPVAVKVLRPGVAASVRQDLALLEGLLSPLGAAFPAADPSAVLSEFRERVLDELDLEHEATTQRRFHRSLRGHPFLTVPAPVMRLAHEHVLVSEWVDGAPLSRAPDPDQAAARLLLFILGAAHSGMVHADPDPDDVLVTPDGRLAILDFGATRAVDRQRVRTAVAAFEAFYGQDAAALGRQLEQLGWLPADYGGTVLEVAFHALGHLAGPDPARLDDESLVAARDRLVERPEQLAQLILAGALPPEDLWPARSVAQLFGTIARMGATGDWVELAGIALRGGWGAA
jgi:predicted unusual protein kinase regulating ubiquinone biosynthesis (AarF/ABC1/UbiB family)